jgi:hypothetical protein
MERATQVGSSQAMEGRRKVVQPRRWLSWGKGVGRDVGKSASHCLRPDAEPYGEVDDPMLPRKSSSEVYSGPYPKPTQVVR